MRLNITFVIQLINVGFTVWFLQRFFWHEILELVKPDLEGTESVEKECAQLACEVEEIQRERRQELRHFHEEIAEQSAGFEEEDLQESSLSKPASSMKGNETSYKVVQAEEIADRVTQTLKQEYGS